MARFRRRRVTAMSINRMIPNALTLLALCSGLTALRFALQERWELAVAAVLVAMLFDGLDGRIARLMGATSERGAQLDSLRSEARRVGNGSCSACRSGWTPALVK